MIIGIVAIAKNYAIGKDGKLPWHYPADLRFFKQTTAGNAVVMGSNTWRSIGKPLPDRLNIVLSRRGNIDSRPGVLTLQSRDELLALIPFLKCDVFIIGGAKTYRDLADIIDKWLVTEMPVTVEDGDVFMPLDFLDGFTLAGTEPLDDELLVKTFVKT